MAVRKTVTVLFSDIAGSTSLGETLDVESFRRVLGRYFDEVRAILERHGGTPEKFIGDAVVALFGVPTAREDDALRALRAAAEIRERLEVLNDDFERELGIRLGIRTGVNTGEVVVEEGSADGFTASGDTMNVAARLEQAASADEILIGAQTRLLGGDAIVVEKLEALAFKGKADRVDAFRLLRVLPQVSPFGRRDDAPLVGRRRELAALHDALRHACEKAECVLATVVGPAGVGKSRLAREFLAQLDDSVSVLVGRCAAYGEGVTFLPLVEAFGPVLGPDPRARVLELFEGDERAGLVADRVGAVFGAGDGGGSAEDTFWAFRRLLERLAVEQPLVLVVDDIHWAEPTLLDLLEYVASFAGGAPLMVLCLTRPELLETRATWTAPRENSTVAMLAPLAEEESVALVGHLSLDRELDAAELSRIVDAADGNPLFLEQLLALNAEVARAEELVVPPTIQALLAARIDHLHAADRRVLECAAIEGREFTGTRWWSCCPRRRDPRSARASSPSHAASSSARSGLQSPATTHSRSYIRSSVSPPTRRSRRERVPICTFGSPIISTDLALQPRSSATTLPRRPAIGVSSGATTSRRRRSPVARRSGLPKEDAEPSRRETIEERPDCWSARASSYRSRIPSAARSTSSSGGRLPEPDGWTARATCSPSCGRPPKRRVSEGSRSAPSSAC